MRSFFFEHIGRETRRNVPFCQVFTGKAPFSDGAYVAGVHSMLTGHRPERPPHSELSDPVWKLIKGCWKVDPTKRKTIDDVIAVLEAEVYTR